MKMSTYNFTVNDYHQNNFTGKQRTKLHTEIEFFSNQINCTYTFFEKILTKPFRNMKIENYIDFSDAFKITKISKPINNIKSIKIKHLFIFSFRDICMIILPLVLFLICSFYILVCDDWIYVEDVFSFGFFSVLLSAFFAMISFTKTLVLTFDNEEKIYIPYGGMLNLNFKKNRANIECIKKELKNILSHFNELEINN